MASLADDDLQRALAAIRQVDRYGQGNASAQRAWRTLRRADPVQIPAMLEAMDDCGPLAANWLRAAVDAVAERAVASGGQLPAAELERFALDTAHNARARRLAYEWLKRVDPTAPQRLIPLMTHDPSLEFRRDAVARLLAKAAKLLRSGQRAAAANLYRSAMDAARDEDQVRTAVAALRDLGHQVDPARHFGFIRRWRIIGPFDNHDHRGFHTVYPPERETNLAAEYTGLKGPVRWVPYRTDDDYGVMDLNRLLGRHKGALVYAGSEFVADRERAVELRLGTPNGWKLWLNGRLLFARDEYHRGMQIDQYRVPARLRAGRNWILLKLCQNEQTESWAQRWQFQLRVCDSMGTAVLSADRPAGPAADQGH